MVERKALITLARSQSIPEADYDPILYSKVRVILDKICRKPPFENLTQDLTLSGEVIIELLQSPLLCGLLLVFALGVELSDEEVAKGKQASFDKEFLATQTPRKPGSWNWPAILSPSLHPGEVIHPMFPRLSQLQRRFSSSIPNLVNRYRNRTILPHYTSRGVSSQTSEALLHRFKSYPGIKKVHGKRSTLHRGMDRNNITSKDVVHHYIRTGFWLMGKTEMKQRWYPHGLLPRTYFAWGGSDIAVSSYLRNFFNDLGDIFEPTERKNRVRPDWLKRTRPDDGFLFYDLTSFTSWFHEQVPFLRAIGDRFRNVTVFLVGEDLTLSAHDLGSLIHGYVDWCNDFPEFCIRDGILPGSFGSETFRHMCAGFLGIPGNLITCTIPHGLAIASQCSYIHELQVPGDDVGAVFHSPEHRLDIMTCASTLGVLQFDKVFHTPQLSLYLKRLVIDMGDGIDLSPMLIYPLLPYLVSPVGSLRSNRFRLPDSDRILARAAGVLVSFHRDLWKHTKGNLDSSTQRIIQEFLEFVHISVGLPFGAIFQGRLYNGDGENEPYKSITIKFSIDDPDNLLLNPDSLFASKCVNFMSIRVLNGAVEEHLEGDIDEGRVVTVKASKKWSFLEDMGYVKILGIPGEVIHLVGTDARDAFLSASEPPLREVRVLSRLTASQLTVVGIYDPDSLALFSQDNVAPYVDRNSSSWRYRKYLDLDDPSANASFSTRSSNWKTDDPQAFRDSVSPEPSSDLYDLY
jgi:hypothetical protein